jgi:hypothetical protein
MEAPLKVQQNGSEYWGGNGNENNVTLQTKFKVNQKVEYWSESFNVWMTAVVTNINIDEEGILTYDLDVKKGALAHKIRKCSSGQELGPLLDRTPRNDGADQDPNPYKISKQLPPATNGVAQDVVLSHRPQASAAPGGDNAAYARMQPLQERAEARPHTLDVRSQAHEVRPTIPQTHDARPQPQAYPSIAPESRPLIGIKEETASEQKPVHLAGSSKKKPLLIPCPQMPGAPGAQGAPGVPVPPKAAGVPHLPAVPKPQMMAGASMPLPGVAGLPGPVMVPGGPGAPGPMAPKAPAIPGPMVPGYPKGQL